MKIISKGILRAALCTGLLTGAGCPTIQTAKAQGISTSRNVTGKLTDRAGEVLPGVNVVVKGTTIRATSNKDGLYSINVQNKGAVLVFSFIGYETTEIPVEDKTKLDLQLTAKINQLNEVAVTALGLSRATKSLTYSQQKVDLSNFVEAPSVNLVSEFSGKIAGVQVTPPSSSTGSARIIIRGNNSITGNNQPLFVIDGIPVDNEAGDKDLTTSGNNNLDYGNAAGNINPEDIADIQVLKGPNAAALYGSRAANGAILITTKKAKGKGVRVSFNSNSTFEKLVELPEYQNVFGAGNSYKLEGSGSTNNPQRIPNEKVFNRSWGAPLLGQPVIGINGQVKAYLPQVDNIKGFYKTASQLTNSLSLEGGTEKNNYRFSYTNFAANSIVGGIDKSLRHTVNVRTVNSITNWFQLDSKLTFIRNRITNRQYTNGSTKNPIYQYAFLIRDVPIQDYQQYIDENGNEKNTHTDFLNPYWAINENTNQDTKDQLLTSFNAGINFNKWLKLTARLGTEMYWLHGYEFNNKGAQAAPDGSLKTFANRLNNLNADAILRGNTKFNCFSLDAFLGVSKFRSETQAQSQQVASLIQPGLINITNSSVAPVNKDFTKKKAINSVYGSVTLGYNDYLFVDATARNDWSSTLPVKNNSYFYSSLGGSFVFTEAFKRISSPFFSFGKVRASYAVVGNDTDPYQLDPTYSFTGLYNGQAYATLDNTLYNPDLKPEKTASTETGLELKFLKNRLSLNYTFYHKATTNQILTAQISPTSGYFKKYYNAGEVDNWGHEVVLSGVPIQKSKFSWALEASFATNRSKVIRLVTGVNSFLLNSWFGNANVFAEVGQPYGAIRGRGWKRDSIGRKLVAADGGVLTTPNSLLGNALPDWIGGLTNKFTIGNFSISFLLDVRKGGQFYSGTFKRWTQTGNTAFTLTGREDYYLHTAIYGEDALVTRSGFKFPDTYFEDGTLNNKYLNPMNAYQGKGYFANEELEIFDASYLKLRELVVGYTLPSSLSAPLGIRTARVALSARNLWTIYKNCPRGIDPQASVTSGNGQGIEYGSTPPSVTYGVNLNLTF